MGSLLSQSELRALFRKHGGQFHGPNVEHASCEEQAFYRFLNQIQRLAAERGPLASSDCGAYLISDHDLAHDHIEPWIGLTDDDPCLSDGLKLARDLQRARARISDLTNALNQARVAYEQLIEDSK